MNEKEKKNIRTHPGREDLVGEHRFGDLGQIICLLIFLGIWISDSFVFKISTLQNIPKYINLPLAAVLLILSGFLATKGLKIVFGEKREKPEVIAKGVFQYVRHPVYLGSILLYLGLCLATLSIYAFLFWIVIFIFHNYIASYEEKMLLERFEGEYEGYKKRVGRWIPRL